MFNGASGALLYVVTSPNDGDDDGSGGSFGWSVSGVPDVDGDGRGNLLTGAPSEDPGTSPYTAGRAYLFSGGVGGALTVEASPHNPPVVILASGGAFNYTVTTSNTTTTTQTFELWTRVTKSNGQQAGALRGPITRTLAPGESITDELTQSVPGRAVAR